MASGTIVKGIGGFYYVKTENDSVYECRARGKFRKDKVTPLVGDIVEISVIDEEKKKGSLDIIFQRKNELLRPRVSNVDQAVIVFAAKSPAINTELLNRFIILAEQQHLDVIICINKIDISDEKFYGEIVDVYKNANFDVIPISAEKRINIDKLAQKLYGRISVFAGPSGVGKSSLLNAVDPSLKLNTGQISTKIERGKHTTRHAELMEISNSGYIVDSPGFTSLFLEDISKEELQNYYREFAPFVGKCRFSGCSHVHEPQCSVKEHVGREISHMRYESYVSIYNELNNERKK